METFYELIWIKLINNWNIKFYVCVQENDIPTDISFYYFIFKIN